MGFRSGSVSPERLQHRAFSIQQPPPCLRPPFSCLGGQFDESSYFSTPGPSLSPLCQTDTVIFFFLNFWPLSQKPGKILTGTKDSLPAVGATGRCNKIQPITEGPDEGPTSFCPSERFLSPPCPPAHSQLGRRHAFESSLFFAAFHLLGGRPCLCLPQQWSGVLLSVLLRVPSRAPQGSPVLAPSVMDV